MNKKSMIRQLVCGTTVASLLIPSLGYSAKPSCSSADLFHTAFYRALNKDPHESADEGKELRHYILDGSLRKMLAAPTVAEAMTAAKGSNLQDLSAATLQSVIASSSAESSLPATEIEEILAQKPITVVIVPGIFGEFIVTRPFEEILSQDSQAKQDFLTKVKQVRETKYIGANGLGAHDVLGRDQTLVLEKGDKQIKDLEELVHVGAIKDSKGRETIKVVFLFPPFASLETLGDLKAQSDLFNRRLEKYFEIMGGQDQNIVLLGYSRGTTYALDMVVQAKEKSLSYLQNVKGVISHAGVIFGSTLADETLQQGSQTQKLFAALTKLERGLVKVDENVINNGSKLEKLQEYAGKFRTNAGLFGEVFRVLGQDPGKALTLEGFKKSLSEAVNTIDNMELQALMRSLGMVVAKMKLDNLSDFNGHVENFRTFVREARIAIEQLRSPEREDWWKNNTLPANLKYYSISASMANASNSDFDKDVLAAKVGYNGTLDDEMLTKNQQKYQGMTGISLNDSQVSVAQSAFIPEAIEKLNSSNSNLQFDNLGVLSTHHWGVALRTVNEMKDGRVNPFPRKELMKALAATVAADLAGNNPSCPQENESQ